MPRLIPATVALTAEPRLLPGSSAMRDPATALGGRPARARAAVIREGRAGAPASALATRAARHAGNAPTRAGNSRMATAPRSSTVGSRARPGWGSAVRAKPMGASGAVTESDLERVGPGAGQPAGRLEALVEGGGGPEVGNAVGERRESGGGGDDPHQPEALREAGLGRDLGIGGVVGVGDALAHL